jgi:AcrR family transcriptional regulator
MPRPRRVSDEEILLAVRRAVTEEGPHVSLDLVAERLGVTAPALFRRFHSRNDLLIAALRPEDRPPFLAHLEGGPDERPIEEQLVDLLTRIGRFFATTLPCVSALRESGIPFRQIASAWEEEEPPPLRAARTLAAWLERARERGLVAVGDAQGTATMILGALQAPIFFRHLAKQTGPWDATGFARSLAALLLGGIAPRDDDGTAAGTRASQRRRTKERA